MVATAPTRHPRRHRLAATAVLLTLVLAACGGDDGTAESTTVPPAGGSSAGAFEPVKADTLTIVTSLPGPGFWEGSENDPTDITGGYEYEMAKAIQRELGLANLEVRNETFDALVAGQAGDFDLALSQVTITDARAEVVDFTAPYFESDQGVLAKAGTTVESLDDAKGLVWAVQTGTTGLDFVSDKIQPANDPQVFQNLADAFTALDAGQVDAVMMDTAIVLGQAARSGGALEVVAQFKTGEQYGGIVPKGSPNLATLDEIINGLQDDGTLATLAEEWLGGDPTQVPVISL